MSLTLRGVTAKHTHTHTYTVFPSLSVFSKCAWLLIRSQNTVVYRADGDRIQFSRLALNVRYRQQMQPSSSTTTSTPSTTINLPLHTHTHTHTHTHSLSLSCMS